LSKKANADWFIRLSSTAAAAAVVQEHVLKLQLCARVSVLVSGAVVHRKKGESVCLCVDSVTLSEKMKE